MALQIVHPTVETEQTLELIGIRLDRPAPPRYQQLMTEVEQLRALVAAKDAHISSLETQVWAWRSQASNEARSHKATQAVAWERECDLIRVLHQQTLVLQGEGKRVNDGNSRRWWSRG